jgi:drug/metabolite transporter (DMT)-like permease
MIGAPPEHPHRLRGLVYAALTAFLWGILAIALKRSLRIAGLETIVWFRFVCAFAVLGAWIAARHRAHLRILRRPPTLALLGAVLLGLNYYFFFDGLRLAGASGAQILIQTAPLLFALIGVAFFRETLAPVQRAGLAVAALGFFLFYRDRVALHAAGPEALLSIGVAAVTWALWATFQKVLTLRGHPPQALNLLTYGACGLLLLPFADARELLRVDLAGWLLLLFLALNTLLAYGALGEALRDAPANQVSMILALNPLLTLAGMALLATLDLGWVEPEPIRATGYLGAAAMVSGVALVVGRPRR